MSENTRPQRRWMPILLMVSLALNLLVVGTVLGTVLRFRDNDHAKAPPGFEAALFRALPGPDRKALRKELVDQHRNGAKTRAQSFEALDQALRAVPFDPAAVQQVLQKQAQSTASLKVELQEQWLLRVTEMSDDERQTYADRLQDAVERGPRRHKRND